jgi:sucrose synthase
VIVGGSVDPEKSVDDEERAECHRMHGLMDRLELDNEVRWIGRLLEKPMAGELYRVVADRRGVFIQPALFEAFGLTVVEAMTTGLPTFATRYGGPSEIIEHGVSGFHIDPNHGDQAGQLVADFVARCAEDAEHWQQISTGAMARVRARYTWELYAERLMTMARVYGYWRHVTSVERAEINRYLQMSFNLLFRSRAALLESRDSRGDATT